VPGGDGLFKGGTSFFPSPVWGGEVSGTAHFPPHFAFTLATTGAARAIPAGAPIRYIRHRSRRDPPAAP